MKVSVERIEKNVVSLEVELEEEALDRALERSYRKLVKKVAVPGFRRGKVPRKIFELKVGKAALYEDTLDTLVPEAYLDAVKESRIDPIDQPKFEVIQMEEGKPFKFKATVEVRPEVNLGNYKEIKVEKKVEPVSDEDIDNQIEAMRKANARLIDVQDRDVAERGDFAVIDFDGSIEGAQGKDMSAREYTVEIGGGRLIPGFEEQLVGLRIGEEREIETSYPEDFPDKEVAGKKARFKVMLRGLKRMELPELNDEFAKKAGGVETVEELRKSVASSLERSKEKLAELKLRNEIIDRVVKDAQVELPESLVNRQIDSMVADYSYNLSQQGMTLDKYLEAVGQDIQSFREQFREEAQNVVKRDLVLREIAKLENIQVTDDDVTARLEEISQKTGRDMDSVRKAFTMGTGEERLRDMIMIDKTIDFLVKECSA
ncbi:MAG TPA: trigger factor [Firmicutes bacterium]|nr:trigger factor [Bacillota bacterium]